MSTMNISITSDQVRLVNELTRSLDFANRSEFFRALLRLVSRKPAVLTMADELILEPPATKSRSKIITMMKATKQYSPEFLKSVGRGLKESGYFTN